MLAVLTLTPLQFAPLPLQDTRHARRILSRHMDAADRDGACRVFLMPRQAEQRFQLALEAQAARDYRSMLEELRQAANEGHAEAQEMLGMVLMTGPTLYGTAVKADRCEAGTWMRRAAAQGSETAKVQLTFLNRLRTAPGGKVAC